MSKRQTSLAGQFLLKAIEDISNEIIDKQNELADLRTHRDDLIRDALTEGSITRVSIGRAADVSVETIRNIEGFRYSRDSRRNKQRNPGPERA